KACGSGQNPKRLKRQRNCWELCLASTLNYVRPISLNSCYWHTKQEILTVSRCSHFACTSLSPAPVICMPLSKHLTTAAWISMGSNTCQAIEHAVFIQCTSAAVADRTTIQSGTRRTMKQVTLAFNPEILKRPL